MIFFVQSRDLSFFVFFHLSLLVYFHLSAPLEILHEGCQASTDLKLDHHVSVVRCQNGLEMKNH